MNIIISNTPNTIVIGVDGNVFACPIMEMWSDENEKELDRCYGKDVADLVRNTPEWLALEYQVSARFEAMETE